MKPVEFALMVVAFLTTTSAHSQQLDLGAMRCAQFLQIEKEHTTLIVAWLLGFHAEVGDPKTIALGRLADVGARFSAFCKENPRFRLTTAAEGILAVEAPVAAESVAVQPSTEAAPPAPAAVPAQQDDAGASAREAPVTPPVAAQQPAAKPITKQKARERAARKAVPRARAAKRSSTNSSRTVRPPRHRDDPQDIPISAHGPDGRPRTILIRPTSAQDVYYYSARR